MSSITSSTSSTESLNNNGISVELKPLNLEFKHNGKTYEIKFIKQRIGGENGEEKDIDLSTLTPEEIEAFTQEAKKVMDVMNGLNGRPDALMSPHSFTLNFTQKYESGPSLVESTLGRIFKNLAWKPEEIVLETIIYKETAASEEKTFAVQLQKYDDVSRDKILQDTLRLNAVIRHVANKGPEQFSSYKQPATPVENPPEPSQDLSQVEEVEEERLILNRRNHNSNNE